MPNVSDAHEPSTSSSSNLQLTIRLDDLSDPRIAEFMNEHLADMRATSPPESVHALDLDRLRQPDIRFFSLWLGAWAAEGTSAATNEKPASPGFTSNAQGATLGSSVLPSETRFSPVSLRCLPAPTLLGEGTSGEQLVGTGAIKRLSAEHGELKSMRTRASVRRQGLGRRLLQHLLTEARSMGLKRLSLETGTEPYFAAASALYEAHGFVDCAPFADYRLDPHSRYMTLAL